MGSPADSPARTADWDAAAQAERNEALRATAAEALRRTEGLWPHELLPRLLARGIYHREPPPDPLSRVLFDPPGPFAVENLLKISYRAELTPALRRLFAERLEVEATGYGGRLGVLMRELSGASAPKPGRRPVRTLRPREARQGYRLKVSLQWNRRVWRVIEILDNQTLEDLHDAIQEAFGWYDDHLYSFFLSGRAWDSLTEVARPLDFEDQRSEPPTADEVLLADLEPTPRQRFLYIFDYGDDLRHDIEVQAVFPAPAEGDFPRLVEQRGEAPPQYAVWDEGEDE